MRNEADESKVSATETDGPKRVVKKDGRGRPPTTGQYVGLAKAKAELNRQKRESLKLQAEQEMLDSMAEARATRAARAARREEDGESQPLNFEGEAGSRVVSDLVMCVRSHIRNIDRVAARSSNFKGTFQQALKDAVLAINSVKEELSNRSATEEVRLLRADNARVKSRVEDLSSEVPRLSSELEAIKRDYGKRRSDVPRPGLPEMEMEVCEKDNFGVSTPLPSTSRTRPVAVSEATPLQLDVRGLTEAITAQVGALLDTRLARSKVATPPEGGRRASPSGGKLQERVGLRCPGKHPHPGKSSGGPRAVARQGCGAGSSPCNSRG